MVVTVHNVVTPRVRAGPHQRLPSAPILLHPEDRVLWNLVQLDRAPDGDLVDGQVLTITGTELKVIHTPEHASARSGSTPPISVWCSAAIRFSR